MSGTPIKITITADSTTARRSVDALSKRLGALGAAAHGVSRDIARMGSLIKGAARVGLMGAGVAAFAAARGLAATGKAAFETRQELEYAALSFKSIYGNAKQANTALKGARELVGAFDFSTIIGFEKRLAGAGIKAKDLQGITQGLLGTTAAYGLNQDQTNRALLAFGQMLLKGKIQAEEVTQQLAETGIPVMRILSEITGKNTTEVQKLMKQGKLGKDVIMDLFSTLKTKYGDALDKRLQTLPGRFEAFKNKARFDLAAAFDPVLDVLFRRLPKAGKTFSKVLDALAPQFQFLAVVVDKMFTSFNRLPGAINSFNAKLGFTVDRSKKAETSLTSISRISFANMLANAPKNSILGMLQSERILNVNKFDAGGVKLKTPTISIDKRRLIMMLEDTLTGLAVSLQQRFNDWFANADLKGTATNIVAHATEFGITLISVALDGIIQGISSYTNKYGWGDLALSLVAIIPGVGGALGKGMGLVAKGVKVVPGGKTAGLFLEAIAKGFKFLDDIGSAIGAKIMPIIRKNAPGIGKAIDFLYTDLGAMFAKKGIKGGPAEMIGGTIGTVLEKAFTKVMGPLGATISKAIGLPIGKLISTLGTIMISVGALLGPLGAGMKAAGGAAVKMGADMEAAATAAGTASNNLGAQIGPVKDRSTKLGEAFRSGFRDSAKGAGTDASAIVKGTTSVLASGAPQASTAGKGLGSSFSSGVGSFIGPVKGRGNALGASAVAGAKAGGSGMNGAGAASGKLFAPGMNTANPLANAAGSKLAAAAAAAAAKKAGASKAAGSTVGGAFGSGVGSTAGTASGAGSKIAQSGAAAARSKTGLFTGAGKALGQGVAGGVGKTKSEVNGASKALVAGGAAPIRDARGAFVAAGQYAAQGGAIGIANGNSSVVSAASKLAIAAKTAVMTKLGIHSPSRVFKELGEFIVAGLVKGITGGVDDVRSTMSQLASIVIDMTANWKTAVKEARDTKSAAKKDVIEARKALDDALNKKITAKKGSKAYENAVRSKAAAVRKAKERLREELKQYGIADKDLDKLMESKSTVGNAKFMAKFRKKMVGWTKQLDDIAKKREDVAAKLEDATAKLQDAIALRDDFTKSVSDAAKATGALSNLLSTDAEGNQVGPNITDFKANLQKRIAAIKVFTQKLAQLTSMGLNGDMLKQLYDMGPETGAAYADALISGGVSGIGDLNDLQKQLQDASDKLGKQGGNDLYQSGVDSANKLVDGLKDQQAKLEEQATKLAEAISKAFKDAFKLGDTMDNWIDEWYAKVNNTKDSGTPSTGGGGGMPAIGGGGGKNYMSGAQPQVVQHEVTVRASDVTSAAAGRAVLQQLQALTNEVGPIKLAVR